MKFSRPLVSLISAGDLDSTNKARKPKHNYDPHPVSSAMFGMPADKSSVLFKRDDGWDDAISESDKFSNIIDQEKRALVFPRTQSATSNVSCPVEATPEQRKRSWKTSNSLDNSVGSVGNSDASSVSDCGECSANVSKKPKLDCSLSLSNSNSSMSLESVTTQLEKKYGQDRDRQYQGESGEEEELYSSDSNKENKEKRKRTNMNSSVTLTMLHQPASL